MFAILLPWQRKQEEGERAKCSLPLFPFAFHPRQAQMAQIIEWMDIRICIIYLYNYFYLFIFYALLSKIGTKCVFFPAAAGRRSIPIFEICHYSENFSFICKKLLPIKNSMKSNRKCLFLQG
jgi:hypothetical protein